MTDYNTKVTFSVPTLQRPQIRTTERPEISAQPIDISGFVNGITKHVTDKQKAEDAAKYEALLSKYASKFDNVQIALEQREIDEIEADAIRRGLSEEGRAAGISLEDDIKIRKNYGEAVPGIAKQTMEMRAKEQEKVLEDRRAEARSMYASLKNADNQTIDNLFYISDNINQSAEYHRSVLANPFSSAAAREGAKQALSNSVLQEMSLNGQNLITSYMDQVVNTKQIDQNFKQSLIDNLTQNAVARGLDPVMSRMSAESIYRNSGIADWETLNKHDREAATQEYENIKKNFEANIKARGMEMLQAGVEDNPIRAILFSLPGEVTTRLDEGFIRDFGQFYMTTKGELQKNGQISKQTLRFNNNREFANLINSTDIMLKSPNATQQQKQIAGVMASSQATNFAETQIDPNNINENDITNLNNISKKIDGPEVRAEIDRAKQSKDPTTRAAAVQQEKQLDEFKANKDAINFKYNGSKMVNSLLQDNANRLRVDANGNVGVIGDRTAWQSIGDFFTGDTKDTIEDINKGAANMSPKDRVAMFSKLGVQPLQPGEKFVDNFSLTDIGRDRKATKEEYMNKAEQAVNTVLPNLQGEERDAAIKEIYDLVNPDRFANAIHKQNMSEEDYKKWYHDTNVKGLQKIIQKYGDTSAFTDDIPLEYSTSVSDSSTIAGGSVVPFEQVSNNSAQVLREYAQRAQESLDSAIASGATLEKGSAAKTKKIIADAIKMAEKLEGAGEVFKTKVSSKSTIASGSAVPAAPSDDMAQEMQRMIAEQSPESYEGPAPDMKPSNVVFEDEFTTDLSEVGEQEFMQWFQTKKNSGEIMEDDNGYDYDWKGFYNDPSTDKSASTKSHFTDKYKKPTHDTFSVESKYAKGEMKKYAGKWEGDKYIPSEAGADRLYRKLQNVREELNSVTDRRSRDYKELKAYVKELEGYLQNFFNSRGK